MIAQDRKIAETLAFECGLAIADDLDHAGGRADHGCMFDGRAT
jgi:hypothetical protein